MIRKLAAKLHNLPIVYDFGRQAYFKLQRLQKIPRKLFFRISRNQDIVERVLLDFPMIDSGKIRYNQLKVILSNLKDVLDSGVEGDIVEMGCNIGTTSMFIQKFLEEYGSQKKFHIYDSFEGLPKKHPNDETRLSIQFKEGMLKEDKEALIKNFKISGLNLPEIHVGWFAELPDKEYPKKVAFAFFDSDFYNSTLDSFRRIYPRTTRNSRILIHDYQWRFLPGVEKACIEFLKDKPENGKLTCMENVGIIRRAS